MTKLNHKKVKLSGVTTRSSVSVIKKQKLYSAPNLALPEGSEDFIVYCDASIKGLGAVLMQREKRQLGRKSWNLVRMEPYASMAGVGYLVMAICE
ncbi:putative reverse transcriptase domain-containing protein [Tanacetum coccineum]